MKNNVLENKGVTHNSRQEAEVVPRLMSRKELEEYVLRARKCLKYDKQLQAIKIYVKLMDLNPVTEANYREFLPKGFSS